MQSRDPPDAHLAAPQNLRVLHVLQLDQLSLIRGLPLICIQSPSLTGAEVIMASALLPSQSLR